LKGKGGKLLGKGAISVINVKKKKQNQEVRGEGKTSISGNKIGGELVDYPSCWEGKKTHRNQWRSRFRSVYSARTRSRYLSNREVRENNTKGDTFFYQEGMKEKTAASKVLSSRIQNRGRFSQRRKKGGEGQGKKIVSPWKKRY